MCYTIIKEKEINNLKKKAKKGLTNNTEYGIIIIEREVLSMMNRTRVENEWVWLDMDGTFVDFYGVQGWLEYLMNHDATPYKVAKPLYDVVELLEVLLELKVKGYNIGVISWSSKDRDVDFDEIVEKAKREWLYNRCFDLVLDKIIVTQYGVKKADTCRKFGKGILVDDEEQNRSTWDLGATINATENIITELRKLVA
jgi:hypothetical protein